MNKYMNRDPNEAIKEFDDDLEKVGLLIKKARTSSGKTAYYKRCLHSLVSNTKDEA